MGSREWFVAGLVVAALSACVPAASGECSSDADCSAGACLPSGLCTRCGDGVTEWPEECDGNANRGPSDRSCLATCMIARCGDGIVSDLEACDEALAEGTATATCNANCELPRCGDGIVDTSAPALSAREGCDEGEANDDLAGRCTERCVLRATCGDGVLDAGEACDDGTANDDRFGACTRACTRPRCGDGLLSVGECCDGELGCGQDCVWKIGGACGVRAGGHASLALLPDGRLLGFGRNDLRQGPRKYAHVLGQPASSPELPEPVELFPGTRFLDAVQGLDGGVGITREERHLVAWGFDGDGLLGRGETSVATTAPGPGLFVVDAAHRYLFAARGYDAAIALREDGALVGWGSNQHGQLGPIAADELLQRCARPPCAAEPIVLFRGTELEGTRWLDVSVGRRHALGLTTEGVVWGWGGGAQGQLGPIGPPRPDGAREPELHNCLRSDPDDPATGSTSLDYAHLAEAQSEPLLLPIEGDWSRPLRVHAGQYASFVLASGGVLWSFGSNCGNELGMGSGTPEGRVIPARIDIVVDATEFDLNRRRSTAFAVSLGTATTIVLEPDGFAVGFGSNTAEQLTSLFPGANSTITQLTLDRIPGVLLSQLATARSHTLAIDRTGGLWTRGDNSLAQRGDPTLPVAPEQTREPTDENTRLRAEAFAWRRLVLPAPPP